MNLYCGLIKREAFSLQFLRILNVAFFSMTLGNFAKATCSLFPDHLQYVEQHGPEHGSTSTFPVLWKPNIQSCQCFNNFLSIDHVKTCGVFKVSLRHPVITLTQFRKGMQHQPSFAHSHDCHLRKIPEVLSLKFTCTESCVICSAAIYNAHPSAYSLFSLLQFLLLETSNHTNVWLADMQFPRSLKHLLKVGIIFDVFHFCHIETILGKSFFTVFPLQISWMTAIWSLCFVTTYLTLQSPDISL